jgi:hypothetical protein
MGLFSIRKRRCSETFFRRASFYTGCERDDDSVDPEFLWRQERDGTGITEFLNTAEDEDW